MTINRYELAKLAYEQISQDSSVTRTELNKSLKVESDLSKVGALSDVLRSMLRLGYIRKHMNTVTNVVTFWTSENRSDLGDPIKDCSTDVTDYLHGPEEPGQDLDKHIIRLLGLPTQTFIFTAPEVCNHLQHSPGLHEVSLCLDKMWEQGFINRCANVYWHPKYEDEVIKTGLRSRSHTDTSRNSVKRFQLIGVDNWSYYRPSTRRKIHMSVEEMKDIYTFYIDHFVN